MFPRRIYLLDVSRRVPKMRTFTELVDILARYRYNEFILYSDHPDAEGESDQLLPSTSTSHFDSFPSTSHFDSFPSTSHFDSFPSTSHFDSFPLASTSTALLPLLPKLMAYCQMQDVTLTRLGRDGWEKFYLSGECVAVATESARSLAGRVEEMRERMERAEEMARTRGAKAFVVTDFADDCQWQPLAASLPGIVMGGNFASAGRKSARMDLERELDSVLDAPLGGLLLKLGTLYLRGGARRDDASEYFNMLSHDHGYSRHPGITPFVLDDVSGVANGVKIAAGRWTDRCDWAKEIAYMSQLIDCACHRRDETRLRALRDEHGRIWRMRFFENGRIESLSRLPRF